MDIAQQALDEKGTINIEAAETALREARPKWGTYLAGRRLEEDAITFHALLAEAELATTGFAHERAAKLWEAAAEFLTEREKLLMQDRAGQA